MTNEEANKVLEELHEVRPEKLKNKAKRLFEAIMTIADERDKAEADLYEANNRINDLLDIVKYKDKIIDDMAENYNLNVSTDVLDICAKCKYNNEDCHGDYCKDALIKYFEERCKQMNIEESLIELKNYIKDKTNPYFDNYGFATVRAKQIQAIETLLTAYEKEKEKNKTINEYVRQCDWHDNDVYIGEDILDILEEE